MMPLEQPPAKKNLLAAILVLGLGAVLTISAAQGRGAFLASIFDGGGLSGGLGAAQQEISGTGINTSSDLVAIIVAIASTVVPYAGLATFVAFVVAGFTFILGFGSDSTVQRAKNIMIWSAVGFIVIILSYVLTQFVFDVVSS